MSWGVKVANSFARGRLHIPGGYYHVMGRGLERRRIFNANDDKQQFLIRLGESLQRSEARCLAWAVMSNHYLCAAQHK